MLTAEPWSYPTLGPTEEIEKMIDAGDVDVEIPRKSVRYLSASVRVGDLGVDRLPREVGQLLEGSVRSSVHLHAGQCLRGPATR